MAEETCTCGAPSAYSLKANEVITHRTEGPCTIGPTRSAACTHESGCDGTSHDIRCNDAFYGGAR